MVRAILCAVAFAAPVLAQSGAIEGVVINPNTGLGIPGVAVTLYTRQAVRYEVTTDSSGAFRATNVAPGNYEVRFEKDSYVAGRREPSQPYVVTPDQSPGRIRLEMTRQAVVSGRLVDREGNPVRGVQVKLGDRPAAAVTASGEFRFTDVAPGYYTLIAIPRQAKSVNNGNEPAQDQERIELVPTYYPSSPDFEGSQRIIVRGDSDLTDLEIKVSEGTVHRVHGVVLNETGARAPGARVSLLPIVMRGTRILTNMNGTNLSLLGRGLGAGGRGRSGDDGFGG
jgi:hypothetical protein